MTKLYHTITMVVLTFVFGTLQASTILEDDSIQMGGGYANDVYYSFAEGEVASVDRSNWDIAFYTVTWSAGIITNEGNGVELRVYPNADTSGWLSVDTTGLSTWPVLFNSAEVWEDGAFNRSSTGHPDYGWGVYNTITHDVVGDSIYILKYSDGSAKKIWIERKISIANTYNFRYADLDGSNEVQETVVCTEYTDKNFLYYSLQSGEIIDREPVSASWDLLFTKYIAMLDGGVPYPVTGVLNNMDVPANRFDAVSPDFDDWSSVPLDSTKVPIGHDWKYFDLQNFNYVVEDSIAFFVSTRETDVYKLVFSAFDFMVGKFVFSKMLISPAGLEDAQPETGFLIYPNPAKELLTVGSIRALEADQLTITDLSGKTVLRQEVSGEMQTLNIGGLQEGLYLVHLRSAHATHTQKLIIQR